VGVPSSFISERDRLIEENLHIANDLAARFANKYRVDKDVRDDWTQAAREALIEEIDRPNEGHQTLAERADNKVFNRLRTESRARFNERRRKQQPLDAQQRSSSMRPSEKLAERIDLTKWPYVIAPSLNPRPDKANNIFHGSDRLVITPENKDQLINLGLGEIRGPKAYLTEAENEVVALRAGLRLEQKEVALVLGRSREMVNKLIMQSKAKAAEYFAQEGTKRTHSRPYAIEEDEK
jgi:DNA-directed RNA polymerase specialized sigma subunit